MEKICSKLLLGELEENSILSPYQFGFRRGLSTSHAIFHFVKEIVDGINNRELTLATYLDFARAFDSVNFCILYKKLKDMGLSKMLLHWIRGYLTQRCVRTKFNNFISDVKPLHCGVPQGSVVGPILFLCYINDIVQVAEKNDINISLYADDAVLFIKSASGDLRQCRMQNALNDISDWCIRNQINLNIGKTKYCCYGGRQLIKDNTVSLLFDNKALQQCQQYDYLGVILDETMHLESNFNSIFKKFSFKIFQFTKLCNFLDKNIRLLIYKQTVLPLVEYVSYMLYLNRKHDVEKLQKLQSRALRLCFDINNPRDISVKDLHKDAKLSLLLDRRNRQLLNVMYDMRENERYVAVPTVQTRQATKIMFNTCIVRSDIYRNSPYYVGANLWNALTAETQRINCKSDFKVLIKGD